MLKEERFQIILERLVQEQKVYLGGLSNLLKVSEDTIRRDIRELADHGLLKSVRGGAVPHSPGPHHFRDRVSHDQERKQMIAKKAMDFLRDGQVVVFDGGTSAMLIAQLLPKNLRLTVVTNSFPIASLLEEHEYVEVLFAGGRLLKNSFVTIGSDTIQFLKKFRPDICLLGICSIHADLGVTGPDYEESEVKRTMIETSKEVIALATIEKLGTAEAHYVCPTERLSVIITDQSAVQEQFKVYTDMGIRMV
ncbi:DeoR/GlpR family DNA-binding transcription regulator [Dyadobacter arcticus]|uniref:DeoR/GlpR family transcriptional regulator of sugar metabolism n=1 Tax=Dyadobacter arcticus TaxID=1078754 RepID=A0ABX0UF37_9BACT|nr:DeoR/GlpR family DNA-binding transcription regulator [Dyadobacter arcticus]NIJ51618.1 DeoR/GlpR family transcriptional regulator of sugar metabolism [Dyadobacter arcticus]